MKKPIATQMAQAEKQYAKPQAPTSLAAEQMTAQELDEKGYCARGDCPENRIKEQQLDLFADCTGKMWSNQLRLYLSSRNHSLKYSATSEVRAEHCSTTAKIPPVSVLGCVH